MESRIGLLASWASAKRSLAPRPPVDGIVLVQQQVGAGFGVEQIACHVGPAGAIGLLALAVKAASFLARLKRRSQAMKINIETRHDGGGSPPADGLAGCGALQAEMLDETDASE